MTIAELQSFNILQNKIEKEKRARTYISEINQKYNKISKRENNLTKKGYWSWNYAHIYICDSFNYFAKF